MRYKDQSVDAMTYAESLLSTWNVRKFVRTPTYATASDGGMQNQDRETRREQRELRA